MVDRMMMWGIVLIACIALVGCASTSNTSTEASQDAKADTHSAVKGDAPKPDKDPAAERRDLERKIEVAVLKLEKAEVDAETQEVVATRAVAKAKVELDIAKSKLTQFVEFDSPGKIERAEFSLQSARYAAEEAQEELAQLEIMYEEQDLEDRTREFVMNRGKRNAQRREQMISMEERSLTALRKLELPRDLEGLELALVQKEEAVDKAVRDMRSGRLQHKISLMGAKTELDGLREKLAKLDEKGDSK